MVARLSNGLFLFFVISSVILLKDVCLGEVNETTTIVDGSSTTVKPVDNQTCESNHGSCKACLSASKECYYCETDGKCRYKITKILAVDECALKQVYYWTCRVSIQVLIIGVAVSVGVVLLITTIVCCYCCCKRRGVKISKDDLKWARQREERKQIAAERRKERAERTEEIRKKYGLVKDTNPYQRFDDD